MKIQLLSDLHIEQIGYFSIPRTDSDLIILAGDIDVGLEGLLWAEELTRLHKKPVIYVAGNHEYYKNDFLALTENMRHYASGFDRLHFMEKDEIVIDGVRFLGTTLWTNYFDELGEDARDKNIATLDMALNDHRLITTGGRRFGAIDAYKEHVKSVEWLADKLEGQFDGKTAVITHHAPSLLCNSFCTKMATFPAHVSTMLTLRNARKLLISICLEILFKKRNLVPRVGL